jgi:REP element-mobilizing transposase RayT
MVIAYHHIWVAYGWWLPNDPRGSTSRGLRNDFLKELGEIHFGRKRLQPRSCAIREFYNRAEEMLEHSLWTFGEREVGVIAKAFEKTVRHRGYTCYSCAIMPDHVHVLIRKHRDKAEDMIAHLQRESHVSLRERGLVDWEHRVWGGHGWKVFLEDADDIQRTVKYIDDNPVKIGNAKQEWDFVHSYDGWTGTRVRVVRRDGEANRAD